MIKILRTNSSNTDFINLVKQLDADLAERDGTDHAYYAQFNGIVSLKHALVLYEDNEPIACGAIKQIMPDAMEVKRMYTLPACRGRGLAAQILQALEIWAVELGYKRGLLETGKRQPEAINLYTKCGYTITPNYGQYIGVDNSVCFEKLL